jgi:tetratricopeptide (TPR) repeat protein
MKFNESIKRIFADRRTLIIVLLTAALILVFWQSAHHEFINYDDHKYVTENPHVKVGLTYQSIIWTFSTFHESNWHPLTWLSHMLDYELYGLNPMGHHLTNVIFHITNTLLLLYLLYYTTQKYWQSMFVAALFALHPLHVESVAWVAERKDVLSTVFGFGTLILYTKYTKNNRPLYYLIALTLYALGLMSKPMLVTLPFVMLLWDFWPLGRLRLKLPGHRPGLPDKVISFHIVPLGPTYKAGLVGHVPAKTKSTENHAHDIEKKSSVSTWSRLIGEKIPFFALSLASCIVTYIAQNKGGAVADAQFVPLLFRIVNALLSYVRYISNMIWPHNLAIIYPMPPTLTIVQGLTAGFVLVAISYLVYRMAHQHPFLSVGWLWYLGTLVPVIGLVQVGQQAMADRYTYIPLIGLFIMISWGVPAIARKWRYQYVALPIAAFLALGVLMICSWVQLSYWKNGVTLFRHASEAVANNHIAYRILGSALAQQGRFPEAERSFQEALRIRSNDEPTHIAWGAELAGQRKIDEAMGHFSKALDINPESADAHYNLGMLLAEKGKFAEAIYHYHQALYIDPGNAELNSNLGLAYGMSGNLNESVTFLSMALKIRPRFAEAHYNLGVSLVRAGRLDEGIRHFNEALQVNPDFVEARRALEAAIKLKAGPLPPK